MLTYYYQCSIILLIIINNIPTDINGLVIPGIETFKKQNQDEVLSNFLALHSGKCGERLDYSTKTFIVNGVPSKYGEFPWHVGIYRQDKKLKEPRYICGGSIINENSILTVAHCFTSDDGILQNASEFFIAAAKYHRAFSSPHDLLAQKRSVEKIELHPKYKGILLSYAWDVAVVLVNESFVLSNVVQPICFDWKSEFEADQLKEKSYGQVAGWGDTEETLSKSDDGLKVLTVPYIDHNLCAEVVPAAFIRYITSDKFCAGYQNGSSVCTGDSGSGLVFEKKDNSSSKYYIRGMVSVGVQEQGRCDNYKYSTYTKVSDYFSFIQKTVPKNITEENNSTLVENT